MGNTQNTTETAEKKGLQLEHYQVIVKPKVTEKGMFQSNEYNQYTFEVNAAATKTQIKAAVEAMFEVKVRKVATQTKKGKPRRYRFTYGRTKGWKKAIVTLHPEHRIDFF